MPKTPEPAPRRSSVLPSHIVKRMLASTKRFEPVASAPSVSDDSLGVILAKAEAAAKRFEEATRNR